MDGETLLLAKCVKLVEELVNLKLKVTLNVTIGENFSFDFSNQEHEFIHGCKRTSPSQIRRNVHRKMEYEIRKIFKQDFSSFQDATIQNQNQVKYENIDCKKKSADSGTQTVIVKTSDIATNTEDAGFRKVDTSEIGINTINCTVDTFEEVLKVDKNGTIHSFDESEVLVEMRTSHDFKSWTEIERVINTNLKMTLIGRPWIANNGRHFKTVGFRASKTDYERWKLETFNWQESGVRAVSSSSLYK